MFPAIHRIPYQIYMTWVRVAGSSGAEIQRHHVEEEIVVVSLSLSGRVFSHTLQTTPLPSLIDD